MYHLGKVLDLYRPEDKDIESGDSAVHALLEMWDENVLIFMVHPLIRDKLKNGDLVLVEYDFKAPRVPQNTVIKILRGKKAKDAWKAFKQIYAKRKPAPMPQPQAPEFEIPFENGRMVR